MKRQLLLFMMTCLSISVFAQNTVTFNDASINAGESFTMTKDNVYLLDGYVYVEDGATLTIEPGTVIKGKVLPSNGTDATSALIIAKGGKIMAEGTAAEPIIFTGEIDDLSISNDLTAADNQLWGGLIILGNSIVGEDGGTDVIEGIPSTETRIQYGGNDPMDNSGVLKYVSIRHGGSVLGADNEINGLTLGGVGNGTTIDYIEVFANKDDGIELFGGTVNITHAVVSFCGDDSYDVDESWNGYIQFALALQGEADGQGDNAIEYDGSEQADRMPNEFGRFYNSTFIGAGANAANGKSNGLRLKSGGKAQIWNSIFVDQVGPVYRFDDGVEGAIAGNIAFGFTGDLLNGTQPATFQVDQVDPQLGGIGRTPSNSLDPRPVAGSPALSGAATGFADAITTTTYRGAFDATNNWAQTWTAVAQYGYFKVATVTPPASNVLTDASISAGETVTLTADTEWILDGYVYVEDGATLFIEPGTVVKGKTIATNGTDQTSALIVARGGKIMADGTADAPIIFTSELDDLSITTDLTAADNQTWGGIIILGNSIVGEDGGTDVIEGIPSDEPRIQYGGTDAADNSGVLRYVSIRHGGSVLGADNEINGLTLGGVGNGTIIDYIEVFANKDDGIELFGGTVNITHAVVGFVGDDSYDVDESWNGYIQFALAVQGEADGLGDNAIEYDGSEQADRDPNETGRFYNATFIGAGADAANGKSNGLRLKSGGKAQIWNSIFVDQKGPVYRFDDGVEGAIAGNIAFRFTELLNGTQPATFDVEQVDPSLGGISRMANGSLDPRPNGTSPALAGAATGFADAITTTAYRGAFDNSTNWAMGWTAMAQYGYFGDLATPAPLGSETITDASINAGETLTLTADREWIMDGYVYIEDGATLVIEPGTVVKGKTVATNGTDQTSALIIARGGKIMADGTADAPIIFTSELDDLSSTTDLTAADNQTWGGIIILGNSIVGEDGGTDVIEGIPSDEPRIQYGGTDAADNSGVLRYVSIRHGGSVLGADNEINGLTLGGVGNGTIIDYIEVFANKDDGIELFGGTVNITHAVVGFVGDDSYDVDESWNGYIQFALAVQGEADGLGDNAIEYDGSEQADRDPNETGRFYNATFIGAGADAANGKSNGLRLKSGGKAQIWNSLFIDQKGPVYRFDDGVEGAIAGNYVSGNAGELVNGTQPETFIVTEGDLPIRGVSRSADGGLNPLPLEGAEILSGAVDAPEEAAGASYIGAFQFENWAYGWTAMSDYGYFDGLNTSVVDFGTDNNGLALNVPAPNPVNSNTANLTFELPAITKAQLTIFDLTGRVMSQIDLGQRNEGVNQYSLNVANYHNGIFVMLLTTENGAVSQKFTVTK